MSDLNVGEIGYPLRINFNQDISLVTSALIICEPQVGCKKEFVATIPNVPIVIGEETFNANEYVEYTTLKETDLDYVGRWRYKAKLTFSSTDIRQSNYFRFRVLA